MPRMTRSLRKRLEKLRNIAEDISGSESDDDDGEFSLKNTKDLEGNKLQTNICNILQRN